MDGGFRIGLLAELKDLGMIGTLLAVGANHFGSRVDIPHDACPGLEIVGTFRGEVFLCRVTVVVFAPNLPRESGGGVDESHLVRRKRPPIVRGIRREGLTTR